MVFKKYEPIITLSNLPYNDFGTNVKKWKNKENKRFLDLALEKKYNSEFNLDTIDDSIELNAHKKLVNKVY